MGRPHFDLPMALLASSWGLKVALLDLDLSYGNAFEKLG